MSTHRPTRLIWQFVMIVVTVGAGSAAARGTTPSFRGIGDLPGGAYNSEANAVSGDGTVVTGSGSTDTGWQTFRWTSAGGLRPLGGLPGGGYWGYAWGASADGSAVVGGTDSGQGGHSRCFRTSEDPSVVGERGLGGQGHHHNPAFDSNTSLGPGGRNAACSGSVKATE